MVVTFHITFDGGNTSLARFSVYDLKSQLYNLTNVPPVRQKILGLVRGKLPPDEEVM